MQNTRRQFEEDKQQNKSWEEMQRARREEMIKAQKRENIARKLEGFLVGTIVVIILVAIFFISQPTDF